MICLSFILIVLILILALNLVVFEQQCSTNFFGVSAFHLLYKKEDRFENQIDKYFASGLMS